nr:hypothetical protein CFP56_12216 [Quercus suber]
MASTVPSDDEYEIPLRDQRYFGAGLKRKRIQFVAAAHAGCDQAAGSPAQRSTSVAETYLATVCKEAILEPPAARSSEGRSQTEVKTAATCPICHQPQIDTRHESNLTHQICLAHSHPPSHIDRTRKGLAVLEAQGWDPDSRKGLGMTGSEGRLYPVHATDNPRRAGLGADFASVKKVDMKEKLDAGKIRQQDAHAKRKAQDLRNAFYRSEDIERYLGEHPADSTLGS